MTAMNGSSLGRTAGPVRRYPGATVCSSIFATVLRSIPNWRAAALLLTPSTWHARRSRMYQSTEYISRPQLVRFGPKMRTFTPRWSDYPTDPTDHFVSGIHTLAQALKPIYQADNVEAAEQALSEFEQGEWGQLFPTVA